MHSLKRAQIAYLKANKALIEILSKYIDFANVFLSKLAVEFAKYSRINNPVIKLIDD